MCRAFELNRALPRGLDALLRGGEGNRVQGENVGSLAGTSGQLERPFIRDQ